VVTPVSVVWTAGFVLLKGAGLLLKILLLSAERWLSGCTQLFILLKEANNNQAETTFDRSQNLPAF